MYIVTIGCLKSAKVDVYAAGKALFLNQTEQAQSFISHGLKINVPQGAIPLAETCEVSIAVIVDRNFHFPTGTSLVSAVYAVSVSNQPVQLSIQHTVAHEHLSFVIADPYQFPYHFQLVQGGQFHSECSYGSIDFTQLFAVMAIVDTTPVSYTSLL